MKNDLDAIRKKLNRIDDKLIKLLGERQSYMGAVGTYKKLNNMPYTQSNREKEILTLKVAQGKKLGVSPELVRQFFKAIFRDSKDIQNRSAKK